VDVSEESFSAFDEIATNGLVADSGLETDGRTCCPHKVIILLRKKTLKRHAVNDGSHYLSTCY
jgi:hypothetical protein